MTQDDPGIRGRDKEASEIHNFIKTRIDQKKSGILYLTGPPGTGKSMSIQYVLDRISGPPKINLNCLKVQTSKAILTKICTSVGLERFTKCNESELIDRLTKKFTGRTCQPTVIVLDEMDELPKSKNVDLIRTIFSWPRNENSKLILIGIANTVNLTSRYQSISAILGRDIMHVTRIVFKPYSSKDIRSILDWYLENDENFEDAVIDSKALDLLSITAARDNGDIRSAINSLRSSIDDTVYNQIPATPDLPIPYTTPATPPKTPSPTHPMTPCKEQRTNLMSVANSIKKRRKTTNYKDDDFPFLHQIILTCLMKLSAGCAGVPIDSKVCQDMISIVAEKHGVKFTCSDYKAMLDNLELQGLIALRKGRPRYKVCLKASEVELSALVVRKDMIMNSLDGLVKAVK